jgi:hypothetical protein
MSKDNKENSVESQYSVGGVEFRVIDDGGMDIWFPCWSGELPKLTPKGEGYDRTWWVKLNVHGIALLASFIEDGVDVKVVEGVLTLVVHGVFV